MPNMMPRMPWGRDDFMAIAAVRYCLGRRTHIVTDCREWLCAAWPDLDESAKKIIRRDIEEAFARDDDARKRGDDWNPLGHDCDRAEWSKVRELWAT